MDIIPHKRCSKCGVDKPLSEYYKNKNRSGGIAAYCKPCAHEYRQENIDRLRRADAEYKAARKEQRLAYNREWTARNREKYSSYQREYRKANRVQMNAAKREWSKAHPEFNVRRSHQRRVLRRANGGSYTIAEWRALCARYDYRCLCCGEQKPLTVDHVIPVVGGGSNNIENLQPLCAVCNIRKGIQIIDYRALDAEASR
jgi:5-methylcytosine-specific restriction endonuclease McrA